MIYFPVSLGKAQQLLEKMMRLGIKESDIEEKFIRSGGKGGQNVNKVSSCVYLKHLPTGIELKVQRERSQGLNRFLARRLLAEKIEQKTAGAQSERQKIAEKIRRQKRKRSKRAKEKMLRDKKMNSLKKSLRTSPQETV